jgi:GlpG protein
MRQIGSLPTSESAQRFTAYLVVQRIAASAEQEGNQWVIWVKNEDQVPAAKEALDKYRLAPDDPRYREAAAQAVQLQREEERQRAEARKNVVDIRGNWRSAGAGGAGASPFRTAPLTCIVIAICILVALASDFGKDVRSRVYLSFAHPASWAEGDGFAEIRRGEVWRTVTPIFLHFSIAHLVFNSFMFYSLASQVERRYGSLRLAGMIIAIAALSNVAQYWWERNPNFGGLSGVVYGVFGFTWMKVLYDPRAGLTLAQSTVVIAMVWLFWCLLADSMFTGAVGSNTANTAHFVGLAAGMVIATAPLALRRKA